MLYYFIHPRHSNQSLASFLETIVGLFARYVTKLPGQHGATVMDNTELLVCSNCHILC